MRKYSTGNTYVYMCMFKTDRVKPKGGQDMLV